jgi:hypothetical protein
MRRRAAGWSAGTHSQPLDRKQADRLKNIHNPDLPQL